MNTLEDEINALKTELEEYTPCLSLSGSFRPLPLISATTPG
jgi:hypothetical protein